MSSILNELVTDNPMLGEATRVGRRFMRSGGDTGRVVNYVIAGLLGVFYLWFLVGIFQIRENLAGPILMFELVLVTLIIPASIYGAISGERERATWEALILTRLTPAQIIAGKIFWRLLLLGALAAILLVPMLLSESVSARTMGSDLNLGELFIGQLLVLCWGVFLCASGLWVSALTKRSVTTIAILIGGLLFLLLLLPVLLSMFDTRMDYVRADHPMDFIGSLLLHVNPFYALGQLGQSDNAAYRNNGESGFDLFSGVSAIVFPLLAYTLGTALFLLLTHRALKRLEEPQARG